MQLQLLDMGGPSFDSYLHYLAELAPITTTLISRQVHEPTSCGGTIFSNTGMAGPFFLYQLPL